MRAQMQTVLTLLAVFSAVAGWVFLSNLPHSSVGDVTFGRTTSVVYTSWEPWVGIGLFGAGISYFVLRFITSRHRG